MSKILEMAKEVGHAIQQDERYIRWQMAQAAADEDEALQALIGEFNLKRIALSSESEKKEDKNEEKINQLNGEVRKLYADIMTNEHMAQYNEAKMALDQLVNQIAEIVAMSAAGQDPEEFHESSCSGNCSGCAGCH